MDDAEWINLPGAVCFHFSESFFPVVTLLYSDLFRVDCLLHNKCFSSTYFSYQNKSRISMQKSHPTE